MSGCSFTPCRPRARRWAISSSSVGESGCSAPKPYRRSGNCAILAYIQQEILPQYEAVDGAHGPEHIRRVISNSLELAQQLDVDINMVYTIAACHDLGIRYGRENHERTSAELLIEDQKLEQWFTPEQREIMKQAVEDHRASRSASVAKVAVPH